MRPPERDLAQRMAALERGNRVRVYRARLKTRIAADHSWRVLEAAVALDGVGIDPELLDTMKVYDLLNAAPGLGRVKINRVLRELRVSPSKTLGGMSDRQRRELVDDLRQRAVGSGRRPITDLYREGAA